MNILR